MSNNIETLKSEALNEMASKGYILNDLIFDSDKPQRFGSKKEQWCYVHLYETKLTGEPIVLVNYGDWRTDEKFIFQSGKVNLSPEDRAYIKKQAQEAEEKSLQAKKELQDEAAHECQEKFNSLSEAGISPYLEAKQIYKAFGARFEGETLYIPCRNVNSEIRTLEKVLPNGDKFFLPNGEKKGNFHVIGDIESAEVLYLAEGFATGVSVHIATNKCVVVTFDAGNLFPVAQALKEKYPNKKYVFCGDDDKWTKKPDGTPTNPGRDKAKKAAKLVEGITVFPEFQNDRPGQFEDKPDKRPTDFNDLHYLEGLEAIAEQIAKAEAEPKEEKDRPPSQTTLLLELCESIELFHTSDDEGYATVPVKDHFETWPLKSQGFKRWLLREYYQKHKSAPCTQAMQDAIMALDARAQFDGEKQQVFLRIAGHNDLIYIDLANDNWEAIEIGSTGWQVVKSCPVKFIRSKRMFPLPKPIHVDGGKGINELKKFLNVETDEDFKMAVSWLVNTFNPSGPYLVLVLYGEQGTAKSTMVKILRSLIDPNEAPLRREPRNADDLMVSAKGNWVVAVDNMSYLPDWLSDDLCRLATGGGLSKREHYTNDEEFVLNAKRPIILNGIDEFVARGDLASRTITLHLPPITEEMRKREKTFFSDYENLRPKFLALICDALSAALKNQDTFELEGQLRMADSWHWISAAETAFGWERGSSVAAFRLNQLQANEIVLNSSIVYPYLRKLSETGWSDTPSGLLCKMNLMRNHEPDSDHYDRAWPKNPKSLTDKIRRLNPALKLAGIDVTFSKTAGSDSDRIVTIRKLEKFHDASDAPTEYSSKCDDGDAENSTNSNGP